MAKVRIPANYLWKIFVTGCLVIVFFACNSRSKSHVVEPEEQRELDSLTRTFFSEASARGMDVSGWSQSVQVVFGTLPKDRAGSCQPNSHPMVVTIDHYYWKIAAPASREHLLFHEMAHCLLQRKHSNDAFRFGECKSWMRENDSSCLLNLNNKVWRKYYLDELFMQQLGVPQWLNPSQQMPDLKQYKKVATVRLVVSPGSRIDSLLMNDPEAWVLVVTAPPPDSTNKPTFLALTVNELALESNTYNIDRTMISTASIMNDTPQRSLFKRNHGREGFKLTIQKHDDCAYLFLNDTLRYCLPLDNDKIIIAAYGVPTDRYRIDVYGRQ